MFSEIVTTKAATKFLLPLKIIQSYPKMDNREFWTALPNEVRAEWIPYAEKGLDFDWPTLPATRYMDFLRNGNRTKFEVLYLKRRLVLTDLIIGECIEGKGRFIDAIIDGLWAICEESHWSLPAHYNRLSSQEEYSSLPDVTEQTIDLFAAETAALLSWTAYLLSKPLNNESPMILKRIDYEMKRRIFDPFLDRDDFKWFGFTGKKINNWTPWIVSNCLTAFFLLEENSEIRGRATAKAMLSLEYFMAVYFEDGGCDEGPGYWDHAGASLFDCLELLYLASDGKFNFFDQPLVQEMGKYIYRVHIHDHYFVNFADGNAKLHVSAGLIYRYGKRIGDAGMMRMGCSVFQQQGFLHSQTPSTMRILAEISHYQELMSGPAEPPYLRDVWLKDTQIFVARQNEGNADGLYVAAKGGHNNESHNHNDIGHYIVYYNGHPFIIDAGVESYTSKTFSPSRYDIWTMQSSYHGLPSIRGIQQQAGASFRATDVEYEMNEDNAQVSMNIASAYPQEAELLFWKRNVSITRNENSIESYVVVSDQFKLANPTSDISLHFLTLQLPVIQHDGIIELENEHNEKLQIFYDESQLKATKEPITVHDSKMQPVWGSTIYRVTLSLREAISEGHFSLRIQPYNHFIGQK